MVLLVFEHLIMEILWPPPKYWLNWVNYSGNLNTDHLNTENIWIPNILKLGFQMVCYSNGRFMCYVLDQPNWYVIIFSVLLRPPEFLMIANIHASFHARILYIFTQALLAFFCIQIFGKPLSKAFNFLMNF